MSNLDVIQVRVASFNDFSNNYSDLTPKSDYKMKVRIIFYQTKMRNFLITIFSAPVFGDLLGQNRLANNRLVQV